MLLDRSDGDKVNGVTIGIRPTNITPLELFPTIEKVYGELGAVKDAGNIDGLNYVEVSVKEGKAAFFLKGNFLFSISNYISTIGSDNLSSSPLDQSTLSAILSTIKFANN